ncbi:MAG: pyridoxamine 5'-phosphate oxidase family protein [Spirochaetia bacterium]|nr:pyridoxamine 5'-phosphate oxidase family protein [Spirochaetia bacterium]
MRRKEFLITDKKILEDVINKCEWGTLALIDENNSPYQVPVNHIWYDSTLYFHSAMAGKKITLLKKTPKVHFSMVLPLSIIPSYFTDSQKACNATQFFMSVSVSGAAEFVTDLSVKSHVLTTLMQRLQAEGRYQKIDPSDELYEKELKATNLVAIKPDNISGKFKLGQNLNEEKKSHIINELQKRGQPIDLLTVSYMKEFM